MFLVGIGGLGAPELMIILVIVVVLFGAGRLAGLGRDLGSGIKEFKKATKDPETEAKERAEEERKRTEQAATYTSVSTAPAAVNGTSAAPDIRPGDRVTVAPQSSPPRPPDFTG